MILVDSSRSSAVSTAVTSASESSSPHGVCLPNEWRHHSLKSVRPALAGELVLVVVDPVTRERAGADELPLGGTVGAQCQRERRPHRRAFELHERRMVDAPGGRERGATAERLHEPRRGFGDLGLGPKLFVRYGFEAGDTILICTLSWSAMPVWETNSMPASPVAL